MIIYFSKVNLESTELLKMYQEKSFVDMKKKVLQSFESGIIYEIEDSFKTNTGEVRFVRTNYRKENR